MSWTKAYSEEGALQNAERKRHFTHAHTAVALDVAASNVCLAVIGWNFYFYNVYKYCFVNKNNF